MSASYKMGNEVRFQERWEFRRRDEDFNSSSDDSKSRSSGKQVLKKHKMASNLISVENDETSDTPGLPQKGNNESGTGCHFKSNKVKRKQTGSSKKDNLVGKDVVRKSFRKVSRKKSKSSGNESASLDSVKIFMDSLLKELEVTRENLFEWMRDEMDKMMNETTTLQPTRRESNEHEIVHLQHRRNFESDMAGGTTQQPARRERSYKRETVQVQHQNNCGSGLKLLADHTTQQPTMGEGSVGQETVLMQQQDNVKSSTKLIMDDIRREGSYGQETIQVLHRANFESGIKLMNGDTTGQPTKGKGSYGRQTVQVQDQNNFSAGAKLIVDDTNLKPTGRDGSHAQEIIQVDHHNNVGSGWKAEKGNVGSLEKSLKGQRVADFNYPYRVSENLLKRAQHSEPMTSTEKAKGDRHDLFVKPNFSSNSSDQVASSMYLTLPSVIPEPRVKSRISSSACNYIHPGMSGNKAAVNLERVNLMLGASQRGYILGMQKEQLGSIPQVGARNASCFDQNSATVSGIGSGFPVPLHQGLDHHFSIPSRVGIENQPQENNNILGVKINGGGLTFSGANHTLSEDYVTNNFHSNLNYKADGRLMAYQTQNLKGGHLFPS